VQFIDDLRGHTLAAVSTANPQRPDQAKLAANAATAEQVGQWAAEAARTQGIVQVVFDRGAAQYHGKVKALADAARAAGLKF
jgi:large subunit ribosomal protein L18